MIALHRPTTTLVFNEDEADQVSVTVAIRQVTNPARVSLIRQAAGLTDASAVLEARMVTPRALPATVKAGSRARLAWAGVNGFVRVEPYQSSLNPTAQATFGDRILMTFHTDEIV